MRRKQPQISFRQQVLNAVLAGASRTDDVLAIVGHAIPAARAAAVGRNHARSQMHNPNGRARKNMPGLATLIALGRRRKVRNELSRLCAEGRIARIGQGRYGPPQPKLFNPGQAG